MCTVMVNQNDFLQSANWVIASGLVFLPVRHSRQAQRRSFMMWSAVVVVLAIVCCYLGGGNAEHRGRSIKTWVWLGAIFGPLALLLVAALPPHGRETSARPT